MKRVQTVLICSIFLLPSIFSFSGCQKKDMVSLNNKQKIENIAINNKNNTIELSLYFDSTSNNKKTEVTKEERVIQKDELLGELIVNELIKGPSVASAKLKPILPKETRLLNFSIKDGIAYVNLSSEAAVKMSPSKEEACLKSIIYSLCELPSIQKVMIQINNENVNTLGGNYNISKPLGKKEIESAKNSK